MTEREKEIDFVINIVAGLLENAQLTLTTKKREPIIVTDAKNGKKYVLIKEKDHE